MIVDDLNRMAALYAQGDLRGARSKGESALAKNPNNPALLQLLGVINCQCGDVTRGSIMLGRAFKIDPENVELRLNFARSLVDLGKFAEAEKLCASQRDPRLVRMRAETLKAQGKAEESVAAYRRLVETNPGDHESWNNLGNASLDAGDKETAVAALERARSLKPDVAQIRLNLSRAYSGLSRYSDSLTELAQAVRLDPGEASYKLELGRLLNLVGQRAQAVRILAEAARQDPRNPETYAALGLCFVGLDEPKRAEEAYRTGLHVDPKSAINYLNFGSLLEMSNRVDDLAALVEEAAKNQARGDEIDFIRALLLNRQGRREEAMTLVQSVPAGAIDASVRARLVGQIADRLDQVDVAFTAFEEMNQAAAEDPAAAAFNGTEHRRYVEELAAFTTPDWYSRWPRMERGEEPSPVFLVGFPRSGTTLLDTILMGHPDTHVLEELRLLAPVQAKLGNLSRIPELDDTEVQALRKSYFEEMEKLSPPPPGKMVIDKLPLNLLRAPLIHRLFPDAKFIFALRHPCDVVLSCYMQNFKINQAMASFLDLENTARLYDRAFAYWHQCWDLFSLNVHTVRYEAMIADAESELRPLTNFLGLKWDEKLLDHRSTAVERGQIRTPSYSQVAEGLYLRSRGRWERYRHHMEAVLPILAPWVERLGYEPLDLERQ